MVCKLSVSNMDQKSTSKSTGLHKCMWHGLSDLYRVLHKVAVVYERIYVNEVKIRNRQIACSLLSKLFDNTHAAISVYYVLRDSQSF